MRFSGQVGADQFLDDRPQAGVQEHQRQGRNGAQASIVPRGIRRSDDAWSPRTASSSGPGRRKTASRSWFHRSDGGLILFAGLYDSWRPSPTEKERTFTIITTTPNALLEPVHDRMPVILEEDAIDDWLYARQSPDSLMDLLRPAREDLLVASQVSTRVNSVKNDDPECLAQTGN